jgi:DNA-binding GntR family transcriptional regulator
VATIDDRALLDLADVRLALETLAAQRLGACLTPWMKERLEVQLSRLDAARDDRDPEALNEAHFGFHGLIYASSGVPLLGQLWDVVEGRIRLALRVDFDARPDFRRIALDHREMLAAISTRDEAAIFDSVSTHLRNSAREVIARRHQLAAVRQPDHAPDAEATTAGGRS